MQYVKNGHDRVAGILNEQGGHKVSELSGKVVDDKERAITTGQIRQILNDLVADGNVSQFGDVFACRSTLMSRSWV